MDWTTTALLDAVKVRGGVSPTTALFTTARLLKMADDAMRDYLIPLVMSVRESYYVWDDDTAINATGVYNIHTRALGGKLDNASLVDATTPTRRQDLAFYTENEISSYTEAPRGKPGIFFKRNQIYLIPTSGDGWSYLRQQFFLRPGDFAETSDCAQITAINTSTKVVTFTTVPTTWATTDTFDLIQQKPQFDTLAIDQAITARVTGSAGTLTFSSTLPTRLAVGDWVCLAGYTCVVQAPDVFHSLLYQKVANIAMAAIGDEQSAKAGKETLEKLEKLTITGITPRIEREGKKVFNRTGILRRSNRWGYY